MFEMNWNVICAIYLHLCIGLIVVVAVPGEQIVLDAIARGNAQRTHSRRMIDTEQKVIADTNDAATIGDQPDDANYFSAFYCHHFRVVTVNVCTKPFCRPWIWP